MKTIAILLIIIALALGFTSDRDGEYTLDQVRDHARLIDRHDIEERKVALIRELYSDE